MKRWLLVFISLAIVLVFCACSQPREHAEELLRREMARIDGLPQGEIYYSFAVEGEVGYLSERLIATLYGPHAIHRCFPLIEEYAIYLSSFAEPCEIAVFRCYEKSDADRIAEMCLSRIDEIRISLGSIGFRGEGKTEVLVCGRLVTMRILP